MINTFKNLSLKDIEKGRKLSNIREPRINSHSNLKKMISAWGRL